MQPSAGLLLVLALSVCLTVNAGPHVRKDEVPLENGNDAASLNAKFKTLSPLSPCVTDEVACVSDYYAQCVGGHFVLKPCPVSTVCRAVANTGSSEAIIGCTAESKNTMRTPAKRAVSPGDPSQSSLTLDSAVISAGLQKNGQDNITSPGQSPSKTSTNNWINFCKTVDKELTDGQQKTDGSCNPVPIGIIPSVNNIPSTKFLFPPNFAAITKSQTFTVKFAINHLDTGWFTNAQETYMSSPTEINADGDVIGHSHVVIQQLTGFGQTTPTDPKTFAFFKAVNTAAVDGVMSIDVTNGLPVGFYRIATINTGSNHQPIAIPIAQHGAVDDMVYFSVL